MLIVTVPGDEVYNEETSEFSTVGDFELHLEHSLISLSKWESKFQKPFLANDKKSSEEILWYINAMILDPIYPEDLWLRLTHKNLEEINTYIDSKQSATTFGTMPEATNKRRGEVITSELIYYWMIAFNIPFEAERWHLNRLFSLIRICNIKQSKPKKMSRHEVALRTRELNAQRKAQLGTSG